MAYTNLRELLVEDRFLSPEELLADFKDCPQETEERKPGAIAFRRLSPYPVYEKDEGTSVLVIGEEGENVLEISKPQIVIVPLVEYDYETPIQERISALFSSAAVEAANPLGPVELEKVTPQAFCNEAREAKDWYAVLASHPMTRRIKNIPCRVYAAPLGDRVIAVREPKYAGRVVTDSKGQVGLLVMQSAVRRVVELTEE